MLPSPRVDRDERHEGSMCVAWVSMWHAMKSFPATASEDLRAVPGEMDVGVECWAIMCGAVLLSAGESKSLQTSAMGASGVSQLCVGRRPRR